MRVLVSGASGYVGRFVVAGLRSRGHEIFTGGRSSPDGGKGNAVHRGLVLDPSADQTEAFAGIEGVVHAAFDHLPGRYRGGEGNDPERFTRLNRDGSLALFEQARAAGVARAVFLSSRAVYGPGPGGPVREDAALEPDTLYGVVKRDVEAALSSLAAPHFTPVALRVTGVYGHLDDPGTDKWAGLVADYLAGRPIAPRVATEVHGRDVAAAVATALEAPEGAVRGSAFNVSDLVLDRAELLALVKDESGSAHPLPARADPTGLRIPETSRLRALGWQPGGRDLLAETVRKLVRTV